MIKIGVLGAGHLGKIHLRLLRTIPSYELVGFYDADAENAAKVAIEFGVKAFNSAAELTAVVDAVDIVTPTLTHYALASQAARQFKHLFIEKPLTSTLDEARQLVALVREAGVKAQVGHVERFNPAFLAIQNEELNPMFIEGHRLAQWNPRGTDVSVVLDLMIHDIDIILHLVKSTVKKISASGVAVISDTPDIANARIEFHNGCVVNLTASRISMNNMRKLRIFQKNTYLTVDFLEKKSAIYHIQEEDISQPASSPFSFEMGGKRKVLTVNQPDVEPVNSIQMELEEFAKAINNDTEPPVTIFDAYSALQTANQIVERIGSVEG